MLAKFIDAPREDSLTAAVFSHLLHLPAEVFWDILSKACYTDKLPMVAGEPRQVDPWPSWDGRGTGNESRVVPDLFIRFADFDLIIEAKRRDDWMQNPAQWQDQLVAYANEYGEEGRQVRLIALGGLHGNDDQEISHLWRPEQDASAEVPRVIMCPVHMCRWTGILAQCQRLLREWGRLSRPDPQTLAAIRILEDTVDLFAVHGFATGRWFSDFSDSTNRLSASITTHLELFQQHRRQFPRA